jgi:hypothetical protein
LLTRDNNEIAVSDNLLNFLDFDAVPSHPTQIYSWRSDNLNIHAIAKPLQKMLYYRHALGLITKDETRYALVGFSHFHNLVQALASKLLKWFIIIRFWYPRAYGARVSGG